MKSLFNSKTLALIAFSAIFATNAHATYCPSGSKSHWDHKHNKCVPDVVVLPTPTSSSSSSTSNSSSTSTSSATGGSSTATTGPSTSSAVTGPITNTNTATGGGGGTGTGTANVTTGPVNNTNTNTATGGNGGAGGNAAGGSATGGNAIGGSSSSSANNSGGNSANNVTLTSGPVNVGGSSVSVDASDRSVTSNTGSTNSNNKTFVFASSAIQVPMAPIAAPGLAVIPSGECGPRVKVTKEDITASVTGFLGLGRSEIAYTFSERIEPDMSSSYRMVDFPNGDKAYYGHKVTGSIAIVNRGSGSGFGLGGNSAAGASLSGSIGGSDGAQYAVMRYIITECKLLVQKVL